MLLLTPLPPSTRLLLWVPLLLTLLVPLSLPTPLGTPLLLGDTSGLSLALSPFLTTLLVLLVEKPVLLLALPALPTPLPLPRSGLSSLVPADLRERLLRVVPVPGRGLCLV